MLVLTRKLGESIRITLSDDISPEMTVAELFSSGQIEIHYIEYNDTQIKVGISAPLELKILRSELADQ